MLLEMTYRVKQTLNSSRAGWGESQVSQKQELARSSAQVLSGSNLHHVGCHKVAALNNYTSESSKLKVWAVVGLARTHGFQFVIPESNCQGSRSFPCSLQRLCHSGRMLKLCRVKLMRSCLRDL